MEASFSSKLASLEKENSKEEEKMKVVAPESGLIRSI
jgi:hypothetical protein